MELWPSQGLQLPFTIQFVTQVNPHLYTFAEETENEIDKDDLWAPQLNADETNLFNARLFPVSMDSRAAQGVLLNLGKVSGIEEELIKAWKKAKRLSLAEVCTVVFLKLS